MGQHTKRECHNCEDATYIKEDYELYCPNCYYTPHGSAPTHARLDEWERWWSERDRIVKNGGRPRFVGGVPHSPGAYID